MAVTFQNNEISFVLKNKTVLKNWIKAIIESKKKSVGQINYVFATDEYVLMANQSFLNHNTYTDIITFDSCEGKKVSGDILISVERVKENAKKFNSLFEDELHRVMAHGVLHLLGYKDKTKADAQMMRNMEAWALKKLSV